MNGREKAGEDADRRRNEAAAGEGDEVQEDAISIKLVSADSFLQIF